jgi:Icc-related predicted phosphoesterase
MKIYLCSDVHLEFRGARIPEIPPDAEVIILAGDIATGEGALRYVCEVAKAHPNAQVLFVAGNHEYYEQEFFAFQKRARSVLGGIDNAHFLERDRIEINGIHFLGCTLWSGFDAIPDIAAESSMEYAEKCINDFILIRHDDRLFKPEDARKEYLLSRAWLDSELESTQGERRVVITHFPPCMDVRHEDIPSDKLTPYFQANCKELIEQCQPDMWVFGHNHYNHDLTIGNTRVLSNQFGYPLENCLAIDSTRKIVCL